MAFEKERKVTILWKKIVKSVYDEGETIYKDFAKWKKTKTSTSVWQGTFNANIWKVCLFTFFAVRL